MLLIVSTLSSSCEIIIDGIVARLIPLAGACSSDRWDNSVCYPHGLTVVNDYIYLTGTSRIVKFNKNRQSVSVLTGPKWSKSTKAVFDFTSANGIEKYGNSLFVTDNYRHWITKTDIETGETVVFAGNKKNWYCRRNWD